MRCCNGCKIRTATCHADCPDYAAEYDENMARLAEQNRQKLAERGIFEHVQRIRDRAERHKRKK